MWAAICVLFDYRCLCPSQSLSWKIRSRDRTCWKTAEKQEMLTSIRNHLNLRKDAVNKLFIKGFSFSVFTLSTVCMRAEQWIVSRSKLSVFEHCFYILKIEVLGVMLPIICNFFTTHFSELSSHNVSVLLNLTSRVYLTNYLYFDDNFWHTFASIIDLSSKHFYLDWRYYFTCI